MVRSIIFIALVSVAAPAAAQQSTGDIGRDCQKEILQYCYMQRNVPSAMKNCLETKARTVSSACERTMQSLNWRRKY